MAWSTPPSDVGIELAGIGQDLAVFHHVPAVEGQCGAFRPGRVKFCGGQGCAGVFKSGHGLFAQLLHVVLVRVVGVEDLRRVGARVRVGGAVKHFARQRGFFLGQDLLDALHETREDVTEIVGDDRRIGSAAGTEDRRFEGETVEGSRVGPGIEVPAERSAEPRRDVFFCETELELVHDFSFLKKKVEVGRAFPGRQLKLQFRERQKLLQSLLPLRHGGQARQAQHHLVEA